MAWHKWFVRGVVFTSLAGTVLGTLAYQHWTNPAAVRSQVLTKFGATFPGATVSLDAASLHLLGYISVHELHLAERDDPADVIVAIPSATLYHNKEEMLDGHLSFRKIVLDRPRLHIVRGADGLWNVQGLHIVRQPGQPVPTVVVHQATVLFEDRQIGAVPFKHELTQVNLTLINDPLDIVTIDGAAHSDLLGKIVLHGTWQRQSNDIALSVKTLGTPLGAELLERLACFWPNSKLGGLHIQGQADVHLNVAYRPQSEPAWSHNVLCQVTKTALHHPELPLPLTDLEATVRLDGTSVRLEALKAKSGATTIAMQGVGWLPSPDQNFEASLRVEHLDVDADFGARLPDKLQPLMKLYEPRGRFTVQADLSRREGQWTALSGGLASHVTVLPEGASACLERFKYPVHKVVGSVRYSLPQQRVFVDLLGYAGVRPVSIKAQWHGEGARIDMHCDVTATDVTVDADLIDALPEPVQKLVRSFHVAGKVDVQARVHRKPADQKYTGEYHIGVHDAEVVWDEFPLDLKRVAVAINVFCPDGPARWEFRDFHGSHGDGTVIVQGRSTSADDRHAQPGVYLEMTGQNLPLDDDLQTAIQMMPSLRKAWDMFQPSGRLNFTAAVDRHGKEPDDLEVRVDVKGPSVQAKFFAYPLHDLAGHFHLHDQRLEVRRLSATHDAGRIFIDKASVDLHPSGALYIVVPQLQAEHLLLDRDLLAALPPKLREAAGALRCHDLLRLKTELVVAHTGAAGALPDVYWAGQVWLDEAALSIGLDCNRVTGTIACEGRHNGRQLTSLQGNIILERAAIFNQPFRNVQGRFLVKENQPELLLLDIKAPIFNGDVAGQLSLDFHERPRYELNLTASQIDLQDFGRHNLGADSKLSGFAVARLHLAGTGNDPDTLDGHGTFDVPNGKLYDLPFLLDLIKFLGLRWPDRTMFEEVHAQYAIRRRRAYIDRLELFGNAVSFTGKGEINLDGSDLHLDLYPSWARIEQLLPPAVRSVPPALSKNLLTVQARGKITGNSKDIKFTKKPMPGLVDPLMNLRDRLVGPSVLESQRPTEMNPAVQSLYRREP